MVRLTQILPGNNGECQVWVNMDQVETVHLAEMDKRSLVHFSSGRIIEVRETFTGTWKELNKGEGCPPKMDA